MYSENLQVVPILFINKCNKIVDDYRDIEIIQNYEIHLCVYHSKYFSVVAKKITLKSTKFLKHQFSTFSVHILDLVLLYTVLGAEKMLNIYFGDNA